MATLPIIKLFEPNLRLPATCLRMACEDITTADLTTEWFYQLLKDMLETLYEEPSGVGLSANQIGVLKKISVIDFKRDGKKPLILINPIVMPLSNDKIISDEVCLSFPHISAKVPRYKRIQLVYQDIMGNKQEQIAEGFKSNVFQHEVSHLYGKVHIDLAVKSTDIAYYPGTANRKAQLAYQNIATKENV